MKKLACLGSDERDERGEERSEGAVEPPDVKGTDVLSSEGACALILDGDNDSERSSTNFNMNEWAPVVLYNLNISGIGTSTL